MMASPVTWQAGWLVSPGQVVEPPSQLFHAYKATQAAAATTGTTEPAWPTGAGATVVDGGVTWTEIAATTITWTAQAAYKSGATEPTWPTTPGGTVVDGTITWTTSVPFISDANCPHSKIVVIASSKVYAADNDIIRYSATVNPLDWTSGNDAGYLPYGLQNYGANPVAAMGLYRSNLVAFNVQGFQMWQVDEDPALTNLITALPLGSSQHFALASVGDDLYFLSSQGVRTLSLAAGSDSLQSGDIGMPIDTLIQAAVRAALAAVKSPLATYFPAMGQYMLAFTDYPPSVLSLYGNLPDGLVGDTFSYSYSASGGIGPYVFSITSGSLPGGLSLSSSGVVTGTANATGSFAWTVRVTDAIGANATLNDTSVIGYAAIVIVGAPPAGISGNPYSFTWTASGGSGTGYVWHVDSGLIPTGLVFDTATGNISGTPTTNATYPFVLRVTDSVGNTTTANESIQIARAFYVIAGSGGNVLTTYDFSSYTAINVGVTNGLTAVCKSGGNYIVVSKNTPSANTIFTSSDSCATWTARTSPVNEDISGVASGLGKVVAVSARSGLDDGHVLVSTDDGVTWGQISIPSGALSLKSVTFNGSLFVITSSSGQVLIYDGTTVVKVGAGSYDFAGCYNSAGNEWMIVGDGGQTYTAPATASPWTYRSSPTSGAASFLSVAAGDVAHEYVAGSNGSGSWLGMWKTTNSGVTWAQTTTVGNGNGVVRFNGQYIAATSNYILTSATGDAGSWILHALPTGKTAFAIFAGIVS